MEELAGQHGHQKRTCSCGTELKGHHVKYCSRKCLNKYKDYSFVRKSPRVNKTCIQCNGTYKVLESNTLSKYCSTTCRAIAVGNQFKKVRPTTNCIHCNTEIEIKCTVPKYCSNKCRIDHKNISKQCEYCNKTFTVRMCRSKQKYCTNSCRTKALVGKTVNYSPESMLALRKSGAKRFISSKEIVFCPNYNPESIRYIEEYAKLNNYNIQHALNGGEYYIKELGYWLDGYDKEKNIVIEYDEHKKFSGNGLAERFITRRNLIIQYLNCKFIQIKENKDGTREYIVY